ncbi:MAG: sulfatase-like hydrolase/transferase [Candidatus Aminicenantes bacterium]|nr:MAG: sulfatase-like hydrolase/transferase [Candidatus Aminicenantes bacterium]
MTGITRRTFLKTAVGSAIATMTLGCNLFKSKKRPMNLVFIMTDQQPISTLGCYGNPLNPTPNLDRLAQTGMRFSNFYISAFPCSPSRASMLTGMYPQKHGVITNNVPLGDKIPSLGFIMRDSGRDTGYFGKSHLKGHMYRNMPWREPFNGKWYWKRLADEREYRFEQVEGGLGEDHAQLGFETWAGGWKDYHDYLRNVGLGDLLKERPIPGNHNDLPSAGRDEHRYSLLPEEHHMASFFAQKAVQYIRSQHAKNQPFGVVLSFFGPHLPVAPPKPWDEKYSLDQCPLPPNHHDMLEGKPIEQKDNSVCYMAPNWEEAQFRDYIRRYYGYCAFIDQQIGRVLNTLTECGLEDSTIVIFTSDHGDMIAAHGFIYKMDNCCYQELANVPFIIRAPGLTKPGTTHKGLVESVDILPTLIDLLGLPKVTGVQGKSFRKVLSSPGIPFRDRVFIHWNGPSFITLDGQWKYALHPHSKTDELYHLKEDPGEMKNLAVDEKFKDTLKKKRQEIYSWLHETTYPYADVIIKNTRDKHLIS